MEARTSGMPPSTDGGDDGPCLAGAVRRQPVAPEFMSLLIYDRVPVQRSWRNRWLTGVRCRRHEHAGESRVRLSAGLDARWFVSCVWPCWRAAEPARARHP